MRDLEDMTLGHRVILTVVIVIVITLLLAAIGFLTGRWNEAGAQPTQLEIYAGVPLDRKFLELDKKALDEAYHAHLLLLFSVWLKSGDAEGAARFANGMRIARSAFTHASREITKREQLSEERERRLQQDPVQEPAGPTDRRRK